jgi:perosamine synthetase
MTKAGSYEHVLVGYNGRLTNLQAALGVAQMERIDDVLDARRKLSDAYMAALADVPGVILPTAAEWAEPVCWLYTMRVDNSRFGVSRDELIASLAANEGVEARPVFPPVHRQPAFGVDRDLPVAEAIAASGISLPSASRLTDADVRSVADALRRRSAALAR